ncbi:MAG: hypothetical protein V8R01_04740 [Bacilli bacterium]
MNKKLIVFILLAVTVLAFSWFVFTEKTPEKEVKEVKTVRKDILEDQVVDEKVVITNINLDTRKERSTFSAKVRNLTSDILEYQSLKITVKNGTKTIAVLLGYFGGQLEPEQTASVTAETNIDLSKASSLEFSLSG